MRYRFMINPYSPFQDCYKLIYPIMKLKATSGSVSSSFKSSRSPLLEGYQKYCGLPNYSECGPAASCTGVHLESILSSSVCELSFLFMQAKDTDQLLRDLEIIAPGFSRFAEVLKENHVTALDLSRLTTEELQEAGLPEGAAISIAAYYDSCAGLSRHPALQCIGSPN